MSTYAVVNPATGETVKEYPEISDEELRAAIDRCDRASKSWPASTSVADRAALVRRVSELHSERREELAEIIVREMGKPIEQALMEVDFAAMIYGFYADNAEDLMADEPVYQDAPPAVADADHHVEAARSTRSRAGAQEDTPVGHVDQISPPDCHALPIDLVDRVWLRPHRGRDVADRDGITLPVHLDDQGAKDGERERQVQGKGDPLPRPALDVDGPAQLVDRVGHHLQPDAATGE